MRQGGLFPEIRDRRPEGPIQREMKGGHAHLRWAIAWAKPTRVSRSCEKRKNRNRDFETDQFCRLDRSAEPRFFSH